MNSLPSDIITEIIVRAYDPFDKLRRFRCVCKSISTFLSNDLAWKKVIEIFYPWAINSNPPKEVSYKQLLDFIQPSAVDGLLIMVKTNKDTVKYGEQIILTTTIKNVSAKPITLLVGATNRGFGVTAAIYFNSGSCIQFYRVPSPLSKSGNIMDLRRLCGTGANNIIETILPGNEIIYGAFGTLTSPLPTDSFCDELITDRIPRTADNVRLSFSRADKLHFNLSEDDDDDNNNNNNDNDNNDPRIKRRKIELPEKFTIYIRYKYDMLYLRSSDPFFSRRPPPGTWDNVTYSNLIPININLSDRI